MGKSIKTKYKPTNPNKYMGNPDNIICRSSWERRFCKECDTNPSIKKWASEEFSIPYVSPADGKVHRYYPDFLIEKTDGKRYIIEIVVGLIQNPHTGGLCCVGSVVCL